MVALGQTNSAVQGTVLSKNMNSDSKYQLSPEVQKTSLLCEDVNYRLFVTATVEDATVLYKLFLDGPCQSFGDGVQLNITILPCPVGFMLSEHERQCVCEETLRKFTCLCEFPECFFTDTLTFVF